MHQQTVDKYIVKLENDAYRITGTRVSLDSVVYLYKRGELPETIVRSFPALTLAQVYGAIAYYLEHQKEIDEYLDHNQTDVEFERQKQRANDPAFYAKLEQARKNFARQKHNLIAK